MPRRRPEPSYRKAARRFADQRLPDTSPRSAADDCTTCGAGVGELCPCHQQRRQEW